MATIFLPDECPLVGHMINSYKKHHMKSKRASHATQELKRYSTHNDTILEFDHNHRVEEEDKSPADMKKMQLIKTLMQSRPTN